MNAYQYGNVCMPVIKYYTAVYNNKLNRCGYKWVFMNKNLAFSSPVKKGTNSDLQLYNLWRAHKESAGDEE